jgi:exopolyphosphatase/pppGpp-phosphohydrolase
MSALDQKKRVSRYGLDEERAEVFPAGVLLADEIMNFFSMKQLIVCFSDLLEGLMWNYVEENQYAQ